MKHTTTTIKNINRELKFRVWDIVNKEFNFPGDRQFLIGLDGKLFDGNGCPYDEHHIVQQYTGFTDTNGKEMYVGDIIKFKARYKQDIPSKIIFYGGCFGCIVYDEKTCKEFWTLLSIIEYQPTIIGHENNLPCKPDHNGECLICDCFLSDCMFSSIKNFEHQ